MALYETKTDKVLLKKHYMARYDLALDGNNRSRSGRSCFSGRQYHRKSTRVHPQSIVSSRVCDVAAVVRLFRKAVQFGQETLLEYGEDTMKQRFFVVTVYCFLLVLVGILVGGAVSAKETTLSLIVPSPPDDKVFTVSGNGFGKEIQ